MADEVNPTGNAPVDAGIAVDTATAASNTGSTPHSEEQPLRNYKEVVELRKETRENSKRLESLLAKFENFAAGAKPTKQDAVIANAPKGDSDAAALAAEVAALRAEKAFEEAISDKGISDRGQIKMLKRLFKSERPSDVGAWLDDADIKNVFVKSSATDVATDSGARPIAPSNTGAPAATGGTELPSHPGQLSQSVIDAMTPEQARDYYEKWRRKANEKNEHPYAHARQRSAGQANNAIVQQLAKALSNIKV